MNEQYRRGEEWDDDPDAEAEHARRRKGRERPLSSDEKMDVVREAWPRLYDLFREFVAITREDVTSDKVYEHLTDRSLHVPELRMYESDEAASWLQGNGLLQEGQCGPDAIFVFNFPRPIAKWWRKGKVYESEEGDFAEGAPHEWGKMYRKKLPSVWYLRDFVDHGEFADDTEEAEIKEQGIDTEKMRELCRVFDSVGGFGERINACGEHDPDNYYYVWGWYF